MILSRIKRIILIDTFYYFSIKIYNLREKPGGRRNLLRINVSSVPKNYSQGSIVRKRESTKEGDDRNARRGERGTKIYRHVLAARGNVFLSLLPSARVARSVESEIKRLFKCITSPRSKKRNKEKRKERKKETKEVERWGRASERSPDKRKEHARRSTHTGGKSKGMKEKGRWRDRRGKDGTVEGGR